MSVTPQHPSEEVPFQRVAIVDDVYAGPKIASVENTLAEFCELMSRDDEDVSKLRELTECDFSSIEHVSNAAVAALFQNRREFDGTDALFLDFDQRYAEVERIRSRLSDRGHDVAVFHSKEGLFDGKPFDLVFLDLLLDKGEAESEEIAKEIYREFKAFVVLMSNSPSAAAREEQFRRKSRLLRGFFHFCEKSELCDEAGLRIRLDSLPKNTNVCHAMHEFVDAIENALGGVIAEPDTSVTSSDEEPPGLPLSQFMHTLRGLGLQDYALLCELTLRDEGHPLGDYMIRLLGFHLMARLLSNTRVRSSVSKLDTMRFTEFLPFGEESTASFKEMYADSLTERVVSPWSPHPWQSKQSEVREPKLEDGGSIAADSAEADDENPEDVSSTDLTTGAKKEEESEVLRVLKVNDDGKELPFLQLGDLLIQNESQSAYCVLTASCDLQFTPENVSKNRPRRRDDTVLMLPGSLRPVGDPPLPKSSATTVLVNDHGVWYSIDWFDRKLLGLPHCILRSLFEEQGFTHEKRLQMGRALELQQTVLSQVSRIGLDVQPPMPSDLAIDVFGKQPDGTFVRLDKTIANGALFFHIRDQTQPVLVLRKKAFRDVHARMTAHWQSLASTTGNNSIKGIVDKMKAGVDLFYGKLVGMKVPIVVPTDNNVKPMRLADGSKNGLSVSQIGLRVGRFHDEPTASKDVVFCLSANVP